MTEMHPNTLRMLPESFKIGAHPAVSHIYFEDNRGRVWQVTIDTRGEIHPKVSRWVIEESKLPADWRDLTADELHLELSKKFLDDLIAMGKENVDDEL